MTNRSYLQDDVKIKVTFFSDVTCGARSFRYLVAHVSDVRICLRSCQTGFPLGIQTSTLDADEI